MDVLVEASEHTRRVLAEELGREAMPDELSGEEIDTKSLGTRPGADDALQAPVAEEETDAVVDRPAPGEDSLAHAREPSRQALGLAVCVDGQGPREQAAAMLR